MKIPTLDNQRLIQILREHPMVLVDGVWRKPKAQKKKAKPSPTEPTNLGDARLGT